jgi:hypothetical protein
MQGGAMKIINPLSPSGKEEDIKTVLRVLAGQGGADGMPYDQMQIASYYIEELEKENALLKKQVEDLRCCGNCFNFYQGLCCPTTNEPVNHYCEQYESDNMTREDRNDG